MSDIEENPDDIQSYQTLSGDVMIRLEDRVVKLTKQELHND